MISFSNFHFDRFFRVVVNKESTQQIFFFLPLLGDGLLFEVRRNRESVDFCAFVCIGIKVF